MEQLKMQFRKPKDSEEFRLKDTNEFRGVQSSAEDSSAESSEHTERSRLVGKRRAQSDK